MFLWEELTEAARNVRLAKVESPNYKVEEGETVVGVLPAELKALYVVCSGMRRGLERSCEATHKEIHQAVENSSKLDKSEKERILRIAKEHGLAHLKYDAVGEFFWANVRLAFPESLGKSIGIREDWKVVTFESKEPSLKLAGFIVSL